MDENNRYEERHHDCFMCRHPFIKHILTGLLVFAGAYCAFYALSDWHFKQMYDPAYQMRKMERTMMNQERIMERAFKKHMKRDFGLEEKINRISHIEKTPDEYKISIDLRPFDNDEKNVEVKVNGDTLTIDAAGVKDKLGKESIYKFTQTYSFSGDAELGNLEKKRIGDALFITIPIED